MDCSAADNRPFDQTSDDFARIQGNPGVRGIQMLPQQTLINPQLVRQKHGYHPLKNFLMPIVHIPLLLSFVVAWRLIVLEFPDDPSLLNGC